MKTKIPFYILIISFLVITISCKKESDNPEKRPYTLEDAFLSAGGIPNLRCLIVYKDDHIVKEKYFHPGDSLAPHDVRSVTKSVMATLIGIAIDKGFIKSENDSIGDYLRPYVSTIDAVKANIKIRDVLTMTSGISGDDLANPTEYNTWLSASDQLSYTLNQPMFYKSGTFFSYNTGASHLSSAILSQASGIPTISFAEQYLFKPLEMGTHHWETDNRGLNNGGAGIYLTPYDMLKIGLLYMNNGVYNGTQVVSKEWINKASTFKITSHDSQPFGPGYGYFWWTGNTGSHDYFFANGYGGQFIVVVPDIKLVIIASTNWSGVSRNLADDQWYITLNLIMNKIIPLYI